MQQEATETNVTQWYTDKTLLHEALARAFSGHKGQIEKKWHVIPISVKQINVRASIWHDDLSYYRFSNAAGFATPDNYHIKTRLDRMNELLPEHYDIYVLRGFKYIAYDVVDATGAVFSFEMIFHEGDADANTGFFATVWDRKTGQEVAHAGGQGGETEIHWKDTDSIQRFVAHEGLFPEVDDNNFMDEQGDSLFCREINIIYSGIRTTHGNNKNQLELMIAVAGVLTKGWNAVFFPSPLPDEVLAEAKTYLLGRLVQQFTPEILELVWSFLEWRIFLDHDMEFPRNLSWEEYQELSRQDYEPKFTSSGRRMSDPNEFLL